MVNKIKAFSQSEAMQVYKAIIGTFVLITVMFIGWSVDRMLNQSQKMYDMIQVQAQTTLALKYEISYNKKDISTIKSCVNKNTSEIEKIKIGL